MSESNSKKPAAKMGRPRKPVDMDLVKRLAQIHCTQEEIASICEIGLSTLKANPDFQAVYKKAMDEGRASLRRLQWRKADAGNTTMLIWLGKQYLGQADKQSVAHSGGLSLYEQLSDKELDAEIQKLESE